jgi:hypothetical protein
MAEPVRRDDRVLVIARQITGEPAGLDLGPYRIDRLRA